MSARGEIRFLLNDREVRLSSVGAGDTLLDHLRLDQRLRGTKEGCAEGDCGACTVLVGRRTPDGLKYETVNACIRPLASADLCHVVTVEYLRDPEGGLHAVQQAMVEHHGSQCGFCTPGIVMSLYALWMEGGCGSVEAVETALQGNLCRCTGYAPIIRAALDAAGRGSMADDPLMAERDAVMAKLGELGDGARVVVSRGGSTAILPADGDDLARVLLEVGNATIVAGSTDVGLWVTKHMKDISPAVFVGHLDDLKRIGVTEDALFLGAGVTYSESASVIAEHFPHLADFWDRIGGWQVRNMGTIGGNIANGSPIGDTPPVLIALGAEVMLRRGSKRRTIPLEAFFIDYGKQDRAPDEFVESVRIPLPAPETLNAAYKISKRRDEDISAVCGAFQLTQDGGTVAAARLAFGGMAATPRRAAKAEAALIGQPWSEASVRAAMAAMAEDFTPLSDWRASAEYRSKVAANLLLRFFLETSGGEAPARLSA
ncbi:xanthine dehydrogenase small subunit [Nisaea acidiphila]|uniref:Xanthine dehydrogenase small subunit n=1 Tax=Nisaea acidiphila TaxID=1862145 RepID=A0A9J7ASA4_9PROT|nr:xanthine dehydrogenase small subunit [Nisaea acidiphila]UUX49212.1 xanthine dehydrogenase small subunit [Nisaea acidiphila]